MPKLPQATAATEVKFTEQEIRDSFNAGRTSHWERGVEYLCSAYHIQNYIRFLTKVGEVDEWGAEFSALVGYLGRRGQFYSDESYFIEAIELTVEHHHRRGAEAIITQQHWNGLDPTKALCLACIPYATGSSLRRISNLPAGSLALAECLRKHPDRREMKTNTQYYVNCQAELFSMCSRDARETAKRNNYHRWLSESLIRRIYVGYGGLDEWDVESEEVQQKTVDEVLQLIKDGGSKIRNKWDDDIKALRRPALEKTDEGADGRTLVDPFDP